jgi:hypothetical protein
MRIRSWVLGFALFLACQGEAAGVEEELDILTAFGDAGPDDLANLATDVSCAAGTHLVKQRAELFEDDGTETCSFTPVSVFVCLEGFCGDGRCEAPEAVPCGCSLDCVIR